MSKIEKNVKSVMTAEQQREILLDSFPGLKKRVSEIACNPFSMLTLNMGGKMLCMNSLSSSVTTSLNCQIRIRKSIETVRNFSDEAAALIDRYLLPYDDKRHISGKKCAEKLSEMGCPVCVCMFCYADNAQAWQEGARNKFIANGEYLATLHNEAELPFIPFSQFRIEAEGDCQSVIHARNYVRLMKKNPGCTFAVWTKNPGYFYKAFILEGGKPENCIMVFSSRLINTPDRATFDYFNRKLPGMFDYLFTVWTAKAAKAAGAEFNCCDGSKEHKCIECQHCYTFGNSVEVNEILR